MVYEAERHEPLANIVWDPSAANDYIRRLAAEACSIFARENLWPVHPLEDAPAGTRHYNVYMGDAGVIWGLNYLKRLGAIDGHPDFLGVLPDLRKAQRDRINGGPRRNHGINGLLSGDTGFLLVAARLQGLEGVSVELGDAIDANQNNPVREFMWGSPGTAMLALELFKETGDKTWLLRFLRDIRALWEQLEPCDGADCLIWAQELYGHTATHLGAVHGFAGNVLPVLRGLHLLEVDEQNLWLECIARTLRATAVRDGNFINWPQSVGKHRPGRTALLLQHCHGAPGIVNATADFPDPAIDDLLLAAGDTIWRAGPLRKGSNICHGTAGNGFSFLKLFRRTEDEIWLHRARKFAAHALAQSADARQKYGNYRYSLWTGDIGLAIFLKHCLSGDDRLPTEDVF